MKAILDAKINMFNAIEELESQHHDKFQAIPAFDDKFTIFKGRNTEIRRLMQVADEETGDTTAAKHQVQVKLCKASFAVSDVVFAYASSIDDLQLRGDMNWTVKKLMNVKKDRLESTCQQVYDKAVSVRQLAAPFNLKQSLLDELSASITEWHNWSPATRLKRVEISTSLLDIENNIRLNELLLEDQLDRMVRTLTPTEPELVALWEQTRIVVSPPRTQTQLQAIIKSKADDSPLEGARVKLTNDKYTYEGLTDANGELTLKPIKLGFYTLTVTLTGYKTYTQKLFRIKLGEITRIAIALEAV